MSSMEWSHNTNFLVSPSYSSSKEIKILTSIYVRTTEPRVHQVHQTKEILPELIGYVEFTIKSTAYFITIICQSDCYTSLYRCKIYNVLCNNVRYTYMFCFVRDPIIKRLPSLGCLYHPKPIELKKVFNSTSISCLTCKLVNWVPSSEDSFRGKIK